MFHAGDRQLDGFSLTEITGRAPIGSVNNVAVVSVDGSISSRIRTNTLRSNRMPHFPARHALSKKDAPWEGFWSV